MAMAGLETMLAAFLGLLCAVLLLVSVALGLLCRSFMQDTGKLHKFLQEARKTHADSIRLYQELCQEYQKQIASERRLVDDLQRQLTLQELYADPDPTPVDIPVAPIAALHPSTTAPQGITQEAPHRIDSSHYDEVTPLSPLAFSDDRPH